MLRLLYGATFVAFVAADVSHLFGGKKLTTPTYPAGPEIPVLRSESNASPDGSYNYVYETGNGISAQEQGYQKPLSPESGTAADGSFRYTSPEGIQVVLEYIADENGFQPKSNVLPTTPPIPEAILRSLEYNAAHPEQETPAPLKRFRRAVYYY